MAELVRITDVSPRDGLQNEPGIIPTESKVELVRLLCETGVDEVEVSSFVSPKWVPQLGDAEAVFAALKKILPLRQGGWGVRGPVLSALVPNDKGADALLAVNEAAGTQIVDKVSVFTAASETFSKRNTNATIAEAIERFRIVVQKIGNTPLAKRGYISCAIACPFEGDIPPLRVAEVALHLNEIGFEEIDLGDTIGAGTPETVRDMLTEVGKTFAQRAPRFADGSWAVPILTLHLHDTFGRAADCVKAALDVGIRSFDGSVAGLGGCPYAGTPGKRAPGNISTELLVRTIQNAGFKTNVDMDKLNTAAEFARTIVAKSRADGKGSGA